MRAGAAQLTVLLPRISLQNNDLADSHVLALLPLLSQRTALQSIKFVHCCHQDNVHKNLALAEASATAAKCWSHLSLLSQLQNLKHITLRCNIAYVIEQSKP